MRSTISVALLASAVAAQYGDGYSTRVSIDAQGTTYISYYPLTTTLYPIASTLATVTYSETRPRETYSVVTYTTTVPVVTYSTSEARVTYSAPAAVYDPRPTAVYDPRPTTVYPQPTIVYDPRPSVPYATRTRESAAVASPVYVDPAAVPPPTPARGYVAQNLPAIGLGTWQMRTENGGRSITDVIASAIENGYRHIDCAYAYGNQVEIGAGIREGLRRTGLAREDLWITSKLWNNRHGNEEGAIRETLSQLGLDYLDLFLVHWPLGNSTGETSFDYINVCPMSFILRDYC
jgi:hypothetical protein